MLADLGPVLVANRGEIAVRVIATLRRLGLGSVAVHSDADEGARHMLAADRAVRIGPAPARESYLRVEAILEAARATGARAIHPGYGFLSENPELARACAAAGLVLVGPPVRAIELMADKITAKRVVAEAGVPVVPGRIEPGMSDAELADAAAEIGYPVLVKPAAGGGGTGMYLVRDADGLPGALVSARRQARAAFGDETLFVERFVTRPRHVEVQVLADNHGAVIHLGERECSLQRRHQKIVEESPSALLDAATRERMGAAAVRIAAAVDYTGAGTVEFIVSADRPEEFFFLEMNTRLQVEHPVTELVTGLDLVEEQLRVAAGEPLRLRQEDVRITGHAVEARVYAEDPAAGFLPTGGELLAVREAAGARTDSGVLPGGSVGSWYDPMLAKVAVHAADRPAALAALRRALADTAVLGVRTNLDFLGTLVADPEVVAGRIDTEFVDRELPRLLEGAGSPSTALAVAGLVRLLELWPEPGHAGVWATPSGWRWGAHRPLTLRVSTLGDGGQPVPVRIWGEPGRARVAVGDEPAREARVVPRPCASGGREVLVELDGVSTRWLVAREGAAGAEGGDLWLREDGAGRTWVVASAPPPGRRGARTRTEDEVRSPMPGTVIAVGARPGDEVRPGQTLVVVEAMKMEHAVGTGRAGVVGEMLVGVGDAVTLGQLLVRLNPGEGEEQ